MTVVIVYEGPDGVTRLTLSLKVLGSEQEPWNPVRAELSQNTVEGSIRAYKLGKAAPEPVALEDGKITILPDKAVPPKASEEYEKLLPLSRTVPTHISMLSTDNERTGIYTYTKYLGEALDRLIPVKRCKAVQDLDRDSLLHLQHEFGIFPYVDELVGRRIGNIFRVVTLHTVMHDPGPQLEDYYRIDETYDAMIVHTQLAKKYLRAYTKGEIHVIPHGSTIFDPLPQVPARAALSLPLDRPVVFCFGFASDSKGFEEVVKVAAKMPQALFVISAAIHGVGVVNEVGEKVNEQLRKAATPNVILLGRFLTEEETNLYASAADCLLYNYWTPWFIASASGALHRLLAAGKPVVCTSRDNRMLDVDDGVHCLKFEKADLDGMKNCLEMALGDRDLAAKLGENCRKLALETSWENVAKKHLELYGKVVGQVYGEGWYDEEYYIGAMGGKTYFDEEGHEKKWSYYNPTGEWLGAKQIMEAVKSIVNPQSMLSVGEGRGTFVAYARDAGIPRVLGLDFSKWAVTHPYPRAAGLLEWGDARDLSRFPDGSFDLTVAFDVMEHIYVEDLDKAIGEIQRVSKRWILYNNGGLTHEDETPMVIRKGEFAPKDRTQTALAGHVNVQHCDYWREKLSGEHWKPRDDLVAEFRKQVDAVSPEILQNWHCILLFERV